MSNADLNLDLSNVCDEFSVAYDDLFEGYTYFKRGWYYKVTGNLIEIKLHEVDLAKYKKIKEEYHGN